MLLGEVFGTVLDMSLVGCYSIFVVLLVRMFLKRIERKYIYFLWFIVFFNLCVPLSLKVGFSLIPDRVAEWSPSVWLEELSQGQKKGNLFPEEFGGRGEWQEDMIPVNNTFWEIGGISIGGNYVDSGFSSGQGLHTDSSSVERPNERETTALMRGLTIVWMVGMFAILLFHLTAFLSLTKRIAKRNWVCYNNDKRIAEVRGIDTPFLCGLSKPIIYLPVNMEPEEKKYVIAHEQYHRRRKDYLSKTIVFLIVAVHWFNPLVWAAYRLFCKDMEISCDEAVLLQFEGNIRKQYAESLLKYAAAQNGFAMVSLTFGEPAVETRIKNVLRFRKRGLLISVLAFLCVAVVAVGLFFRPMEAKADTGKPTGNSVVEGEDNAGDSQDVPRGADSQDELSSATMSWYGSYTVTKYFSQGISALSLEDMESMIGRSCGYWQDRFSEGENVLEQPSYQVETVSKEDFAAGLNQRITFDTLGISGESILSVSIENSYDFGSYFYVDEEGNLLILYEGVFFATARSESQALVLEETDKEFLEAMCLYAPDFSGYSEIDENFWKTFIFLSFTCPEVDEEMNPLPIYGEGEWKSVWREELEFEEPVLKISEEDVREYAALTFGMEMPQFRPEFDQMQPGQTSLYWEDGYYYIGGSDFPDEQFYYRDCEMHKEGNLTYAIVTYDIHFEGEEAGTVTLTLYPAQNGRGYVLAGKTTEMEW